MIVPTTTGVGKALTEFLPHLARHIQGMSLRVPTQNISLIDLTATVSKETSKEKLLSIYRQAASGDFARELAKWVEMKNGMKQQDQPVIAL